jgi:aspartate aminotransferase-like enzyme
MSSLRPELDPDGLLEYSVVFTDRSLNHMSARFQQVMRDLDSLLRSAYHAQACALVPGGGSYAMEAVARQLATDEHCLVLRNGLFSYRWTQIFDAGQIPASTTVLQARPLSEGPQAPYTPAPLDEVVATIERERPAVVFAPHVETSAGMMLPDDYLRAVAAATHKVGGLFVLDAVASGCCFIDMVDVGVDVLISAPQKGWSAPPSCGIVLLSAAGEQAVRARRSTSFANDLGRWLEIMDAYLAGGHAYHATLPTDALAALRDAVAETAALGLSAADAAQRALGESARALLESAGFPSVAAQGYQAPGVVVSYTTDPEVKSGRAFAAAGLQVAAGVPLRCGEGADFSTFRIGLFGLDKLKDIPAATRRLAEALAVVTAGGSLAD